MCIILSPMDRNGVVALFWMMVVVVLMVLMVLLVIVVREEDIKRMIVVGGDHGGGSDGTGDAGVLGADDGNVNGYSGSDSDDTPVGNGDDADGIYYWLSLTSPGRERPVCSTHLALCSLDYPSDA